MSNTKEYVKKYNKKYFNSYIGKMAMKKYQQSEKGKITKKRANKKYNNSLNGKLRNKIYWQSEKGKLVKSRIMSKRERELDFNLLYENIIDEKINWHHLNNKDVIAIPEDLHKLYSGGNPIEHRFMVNQLIWQIYG